MNKIITLLCLLALMSLPCKSEALSRPGCFAVADTAFVNDTAHVVSTRLSADTLVVDTTLMVSTTYVVAPSAKVLAPTGAPCFGARVARHLSCRMDRQPCPHPAIPAHGFKKRGQERLLHVVFARLVWRGRHHGFACGRFPRQASPQIQCAQSVARRAPRVVSRRSQGNARRYALV